MIERTFLFGEGNRLVGTACLPDPEASSGSAIGQILFNAGIVPRVGPHRLNVRLARRLAKRGIASLRFDLSGLGDSARAQSIRPFNEQVVVDLRAAMDALGELTSKTQFSMLGFCSGGWYGYSTAPADARVVGLMLYDAYYYPTIRFLINRYRMRAAQSGIARSIVRWCRNRFLLAIGRLHGKGNPSEGDPWLGTLSLFPRPSKHEFSQALTDLHRRGVKLGVMYSEDVERYNYPAQFRDAFPHLLQEQIVSLDFFHGADHTLTGMSAQARFMDRVEEWVVDLDQRRRNQVGR